MYAGLRNCPQLVSSLTVTDRLVYQCFRSFYLLSWRSGDFFTASCPRTPRSPWHDIIIVGYFAMAVDFSNTLVIGISSRALFDLDLEDKIYCEDGLEAFRKYQRQNEKMLLDPGTGFPLVKALLELNNLQGSKGSDRRVEVILMSQNHPDVVLRVFKSINEHALDITRAALTGGDLVAPYLNAFQVDLFLSADERDVAHALQQGVASGVIYRVPESTVSEFGRVRIAFDGDCVLFSDEAQKVEDEGGLPEFHKHEAEKAQIPLGEGPFAKLLKTISAMQGPDQQSSPFDIALVTARNAPALERPLRTLEHWGVRVDQAFFMGGLPKSGVLEAFQPHIFFDDQHSHCEAAAPTVSTARVPTSRPETHTTTIAAIAGEGRDEFLLVCKKYLKGEYDNFSTQLESFYDVNVAGLDSETRGQIREELVESIQGTPRGEQRRSRSERDSAGAKLLSFLDSLVQKHRRQ